MSLRATESGIGQTTRNAETHADRFGSDPVIIDQESDPVDSPKPAHPPLVSALTSPPCSLFVKLGLPNIAVKGPYGDW